MLGFYNYTVALTYLGTLISFTGITFACNQNLHAAVLCLMIAGFCDMFDGKIASTRVRTDQEKRFGIQIDSLSDLVSFGVLPALVIYQVSSRSDFGFFAGAVYLLCALIRLSYFNVEEETRQEQTERAREAYLGLPVTSAALIVPAQIGLRQHISWPIGRVGPGILLLMAVGFITPFHLKKPAAVGKIVMIFCGVLELLLLLTGKGTA